MHNRHFATAQTSSSSSSPSSSRPAHMSSSCAPQNFGKRKLFLVFVAVILLQAALIYGSVVAYKQFKGRKRHKYTVHVAPNPFANQGGQHVVVGMEKGEPDLVDGLQQQQQQQEENAAAERRRLAFEAATKSVLHYHVPRTPLDKNLPKSVQARHSALENAKLKKLTDETWRRHLKMYDLFQQLQESLEEEHEMFAAKTNSFLRKYSSSFTPTSSSSSSSSSSSLAAKVHLALIANDFYTAVDAYFLCSFGSDELRPFQCSGFNWPSAVQLVAETGPQREEGSAAGGAAHEEHKHVGALLTLVDALSTLILVDSAVTHEINHHHHGLFHDLFHDRFDTDHRHQQQQQQQEQSKSSGNNDNNFDESASALRSTLGLSNATVRTIDAILSQLKNRLFVHSERFLSTFELTIRMVGGLTSAHDLLLRQLELKKNPSSSSSSQNKHQQEQVRSVARSLLEIALALGNSLTDAFTTGASLNQQRPHFSHTQKFGFPLPFFRARDGRATNPRGDKALYLSEQGTFSLEFAALSRATGCSVFDLLWKEIDFELTRARPSRARERRWRQMSWRKRLLRMSETGRGEEQQDAGGGGGGSGAEEEKKNVNNEDSGFRFSVLFPGSPQLFHQNNNPQHLVAGAAVKVPILSNQVQVVWKNEQVTMGPLADSYFEYVVKNVVAEQARRKNRQQRKHKEPAGEDDNQQQQQQQQQQQHRPPFTCHYEDEAVEGLSKLHNIYNVDDHSVDTAQHHHHHQRLERLLDSIDDLLVDCFRPSKDYARDWLRQQGDQVEGNNESSSTSSSGGFNAGTQEKDLYRERCFLSTLKGAVQSRRMTHLSCFVGGSFALAASSSLSSQHDDDDDDDDTTDKKKKMKMKSVAAAKRRLRLAKGLALTCSDMSRLTREGIAGEDYEAISELKVGRPSSNNNNASHADGGGRADVQAEEIPEEQMEHFEITGMRLKVDRRGWVNQQHVLRPEALEAMWYSAVVDSFYASQGEDSVVIISEFHETMRRESWRLYTGMRRRCRSPRTGGWSGLKRTRPKKPRMATATAGAAAAADRGTNMWDAGVQFRDVYDDVMMSFAFAETFKYVMMMLADCQEHRREAGNLFLEVACDAPLGRGWIFNTEAHPLRI